MFYSEFILTKKGPLAKIWLAAHWEKKLTKTQVTETDIADTVKGIIQPVVPIALRTSGHLLLGVVKIYSKKVRYVLHDCNETLTKIKLQVIPFTKVDLPEKSLVASVNAITLPERVTELDLVLPEYDVSALSAQAASAFVSDTLTVEEEVTTGSNLVARLQDITVDDFDAWYPEEEATLLPTIPLEQRVAPTPASAEQLRRAEDVFQTGIPFPLLATQEEAWGGAETGFGVEEIPPSPRSVEASRLSVALAELGTPGAVIEVPTAEEVVPPVVPAPTRPRKRPRGVQIDATTEISAKRFKQLLQRGPTRVSSFAPRTPEELVAQQSVAVEAFPTLQDILRQPASGADLPAPFLEMFRRNIEHINVRQPAPPVDVAREGPEEARIRLEEIRRELSPERVEEWGGDVGVTGFEEMPMEPEAARRISALPSPITMIEDDIEDIIFDVYRTPEERRRVSHALGRPAEEEVVAPTISEEEKTKIIEEEMARERELRERSRRDQEELRRTYVESGITDRTLKVMNIFNEAFKAQTEINLNKMIEGKKRITAARCFYEVLVLKTKNFIDVRQESPYADIVIRRGARFNV
jgi:cohesin complex subunit SCC1